MCSVSWRASPCRFSVAFIGGGGGGTGHIGPGFSSFWVVVIVLRESGSVQRTDLLLSLSPPEVLNLPLKKKKSAYLLVRWGSPLALISFWSPLFLFYFRVIVHGDIFLLQRVLSSSHLTCCHPIYLAQWCSCLQVYYNVSSVFCASSTSFYFLSYLSSHWFAIIVFVIKSDNGSPSPSLEQNPVTSGSRSSRI